MNRRVYLGLDLGTTRLKGGVFDERGHRVALAVREAPGWMPNLPPGRIEFDIEAYWRVVVEVIADLVAALDRCAGADSAFELRALGLSSQAQSFVPVDADGLPLRPAISWLDARAVEEACALRERFGREAFASQSGFNDLVPLLYVAKLLWLRRNEPEICIEAERYPLLRDYILYRLTGQWAGDPTLATLGGVYHRFRGEYWGEMLEAAGIPVVRLPRLVDSCAAAGTVQKAAAVTSGLPEGVPVAPGCLDQIAAACGVGNVRPGMVSVNGGTVMTIFLTRGVPDVDPEGRMLGGNHVVPGRYFLMPYIQSAGSLVDWFRAQLGEGLPYETLEKEAEAVPAGADGLVVLPHLTGSFSPVMAPGAKGQFCDLAPIHTRGHFYRAIIEGIAYALRENLDLLESFGASPDQLPMLGGLEQSGLWLRTMADVGGRPVAVPAEPEASVLGAAMMAAVAVGDLPDLPAAAEQCVRFLREIDPRPELQAIYAERLARYRTLFQATLAG